MVSVQYSCHFKRVYIYYRPRWDADCACRSARLYPLHKNSTLLFLQYGVSDIINTHCKGIQHLTYLKIRKLVR